MLHRPATSAPGADRVDSVIVDDFTLCVGRCEMEKAVPAEVEAEAIINTAFIIADASAVTVVVADPAYDAMRQRGIHRRGRS